MTLGDSGSVPAPPMRRKADPGADADTGTGTGTGIARVTAPEDS